MISATYRFESYVFRPKDVITLGANNEILADLYPHVAALIAQALSKVSQHIYQPK